MPRNMVRREMRWFLITFMTVPAVRIPANGLTIAMSGRRLQGQADRLDDVDRVEIGRPLSPTRPLGPSPLTTDRRYTGAGRDSSTRFR